MFSFSQENDRILEIKDLYSKIISATPHSIDTVSWTEAVNENTYNLKRTFIYSYFENNLSKINCEIMQDHFLISSEYYFENNELFFIFLKNDFGNEKEENRLYFNKFGGIEKLLVNYGNGNEEIKDEDEINIIKESTLNWLEKGNAKLENREKPDEETLNIQLNYDKVIIEKKSDLEAEINVIAENDFDWYDKLPLPKWYKNLTLDDKPAPKWLFYWSIFLFVFLLFRNERKSKRRAAQAIARAKEKEDQAKESKKQLLKWTKEREKIRRNKLKEYTKLWGEFDAGRILDKQVWIGMSRSQLISSKGNPNEIKNQQIKTKIKENFFYNPRKTRQNTINYEYRVDLEDDIVVGYKDL
tara:strand:- start:519 stop:1586 length:1068 start_codon:yes stop_codon:yes gene_type:complete